MQYAIQLKTIISEMKQPKTGVEFHKAFSHSRGMMPIFCKEKGEILSEVC